MSKFLSITFFLIFSAQLVVAQTPRPSEAKPSKTDIEKVSKAPFLIFDGSWNTGKTCGIRFKPDKISYTSKLSITRGISWRDTKDQRLIGLGEDGSVTQIISSDDQDDVYIKRDHPTEEPAYKELLDPAGAKLNVNAENSFLYHIGEDDPVFYYWREGFQKSGYMRIKDGKLAPIFSEDLFFQSIKIPFWDLFRSSAILMPDGIGPGYTVWKVDQPSFKDSIPEPNTAQKALMLSKFTNPYSKSIINSKPYYSDAFLSLPGPGSTRGSLSSRPQPIRVRKLSHTKKYKWSILTAGQSIGTISGVDGLGQPALLDGKSPYNYNVVSSLYELFLEKNPKQKFPNTINYIDIGSLQFYSAESKFLDEHKNTSVMYANGKLVQRHASSGYDNSPSRSKMFGQGKDFEGKDFEQYGIISERFVKIKSHPNTLVFSVQLQSNPGIGPKFQYGILKLNYETGESELIKIPKEQLGYKTAPLFNSILDADGAFVGINHQDNSYSFVGKSTKSSRWAVHLDFE